MTDEREFCARSATKRRDKSGVCYNGKPIYLFKTKKKITNRILRFKHNRFNLTFQLGYNFSVDVHGTIHSLILPRAVHLHVKEPLFVAGCRCLGLLSKFISVPLWRLIESTGQMLNTFVHYEILFNF
ncbi:hypothetical protein KUTeg_011704 [Tegillarca granosa]|uniref:Uncharacterized protein n=1 Tax=Tegillarca granosa TaxID=220873 RepID=A0ABQ9EXP3_TEGGR|nr:hypothetical protein KUTeg_011704 [Tegillarca granosa]